MRFVKNKIIQTYERLKISQLLLSNCYLRKLSVDVLQILNLFLNMFLIGFHFAPHWSLETYIKLQLNVLMFRANSFYIEKFSKKNL
jgi:hypothetical protein